MQEIKAEKPPQNLKARIISLVAAGLGLLLVVVLILGGGAAGRQSVGSFMESIPVKSHQSDR